MSTQVAPPALPHCVPTPDHRFDHFRNLRSLSEDLTIQMIRAKNALQGSLEHWPLVWYKTAAMTESAIGRIKTLHVRIYERTALDIPVDIMVTLSDFGQTVVFDVLLDDLLIIDPQPIPADYVAALEAE